MRGKTQMALGCSLLLVLAGTAGAQATNDDLQSEMAALKAEVAQLKAQQSDTWLNEQRSEEVKALIADVLQDADTRASLLESHSSAGHNGKHFFLASDDGSFLLEISGQIQFRYVWNSRSEKAFEDEGLGEDVSFVDDEDEAGFEVRRTKIKFAGHIGDPAIKYLVRLAVDRGDNSVNADTIVISYDLGDGWTLWGGETKAPFLREELVSSSRQLAVERSYVNEIFTADYVQGFGLNIDLNDSAKLAVALTDGARSGSLGTNRFTQSTPAQVPADEVGDPILLGSGDEPAGCGSADTPFDGEIDPVVDCGDSSISKDFYGDRSDFAVTARVDVRLDGDWSQASDFSAWEGEDQALFIGGAVHYEVGETGDSSLNNDFFAWTIDASFETQGLNVFAAFIGHHTDVESDSFADDSDLYGVVVQGGYMIVPDKLEPFIRYEYIDLDEPDHSVAVGTPASTSTRYDDEISIVTVGANYYLNRHNAKFTVDVVWALDPLPIAQTGLGLLVDDPGSDDQVALRAQFQLLF